SVKGLIHPAVTRNDDAARRIKIKNSRRCITHPELHKVHSVCSRVGTRHCENQSKVITVAGPRERSKAPSPQHFVGSDNLSEIDFSSRDHETPNLANLAAAIPAWG